MPTLVETVQKTGCGTWIEIRLNPFVKNLQTLKSLAGPTTQVMAVVKANAYGHGLAETARALAGQVTYLGISSLYEALELREHGINVPLFLFGRHFGQELKTAIKNGLILSVSSLEEAEEISETSQMMNMSTFIHIKVDSGMGRLGIRLDECATTIPKIARLSGLHMEGIFTHFPTAEKKDGVTLRQIDAFSRLIHFLEETKGIRFRLRHAANSAASLMVKNPLFNLIRPGLLLYGIYPDASLKKIEHFSPALSLKSRIILVKRLQAGDSVGYGREFIAEKPSTIATLPIGYSHGYPVQLSNRAWVLYKGKRYPVAGRVSMDYLCVNLGDAKAQPGEEMTLIGEDGNDSITAEEMAEWAKTIPYEIVTRLSPRLPRFYS